MGDIAARKLEIIQAISQMRGEQEIAQLEAAVQQIQQQNQLIQKYAIKKIPEKFDAEAVRRKWGYKKTDKDEFMRLIQELDIQEPIEELLAMLTK